MRDGVHTLRGTIPITIGTFSTYGESSLARIFQYSSPDQTRAWRIRYAAVWINGSFTGTAGGDSRTLVQTTLATDTLTATGAPPGISSGDLAATWLRVMSPDDNRTIAWTVQDYQNRDATNGDFIVPTGGTGPQQAMTLDFERLVTNELWLAVYAATESGEAVVDLAYYIEMEAIKIKPEESVLQILKGQGQDIGAPLLVEDTT